MSGWGGRSRGAFARGFVAFSLSLMFPYFFCNVFSQLSKGGKGETRGFVLTALGYRPAVEVVNSLMYIHPVMISNGQIQYDETKQKGGFPQSRQVEASAR